MSTETLQPEAGDDRNREAEIARLQEMYDAPARLEPGPGDIVVRQAGKCGYLLLSRAGVTRIH